MVSDIWKSFIWVGYINGSKKNVITRLCNIIKLFSSDFKMGG